MDETFGRSQSVPNSTKDRKYPQKRSYRRVYACCEVPTMPVLVQSRNNFIRIDGIHCVDAFDKWQHTLQKNPANVCAFRKVRASELSVKFGSRLIDLPLLQHARIWSPTSSQHRRAFCCEGEKLDRSGLLPFRNKVYSKYFLLLC